MDLKTANRLWRHIFPLSRGDRVRVVKAFEHPLQGTKNAFGQTGEIIEVYPSDVNPFQVRFDHEKFRPDPKIFHRYRRNELELVTR